MVSLPSTLIIPGTLAEGTLGFSDTNVLASFQSSVNTYNQLLIQNTNSGTVASADVVVTNNLSTSTTYYGDFGINSSGFTGSGSFNAANAVYLSATSGDLVLGTTTSNAIRFVINGGTTDAFGIGTAGQFLVAGSPGTSGYVLTSAGASSPPVWSAGGGGGTSGYSGYSGTSGYSGYSGFSGIGTLTYPVTIVSGTSQLAVAGNQYVMTNAGTSTLTLPASPSLGDSVWVSVGNSRTDTIVAGNGQNIENISSNLVIDISNYTVMLRYVNSTIGWTVVGWSGTIIGLTLANMQAVALSFP